MVYCIRATTDHYTGGRGEDEYSVEGSFDLLQHRYVTMATT